MEANNMKAMREALKGAIDTLKLVVEHEGEFMQPHLYEEVVHTGSALEAALAAPPRNCDRYASGNPQEDAWNVLWACGEDLGSAAGVVRMLEWLFATAKKGAGDE